MITALVSLISERMDVDLWIACANGPLRELLTATGLTKRLGAEHIFPLVRAAVTAYHVRFGTSQICHFQHQPPSLKVTARSTMAVMPAAVHEFEQQNQ